MTEHTEGLQNLCNVLCTSYFKFCHYFTFTSPVFTDKH